MIAEDEDFNMEGNLGDLRKYNREVIIPINID